MASRSHIPACWLADRSTTIGAGVPASWPAGTISPCRKAPNSWAASPTPTRIMAAWRSRSCRATRALQCCRCRPILEPHDVQHRLDPQLDQSLAIRVAARPRRAARAAGFRRATPSGTASTNTCSTRSTAAGRSAGGLSGSTIRGLPSHRTAAGQHAAAVPFPGSFYETSLGLNYKPNANLTIRPELRYDWYDGLAGQPRAYLTLPTEMASTRTSSCSAWTSSTSSKSGQFV